MDAQRHNWALKSIPAQIPHATHPPSFEVCSHTCTHTCVHTHEHTNTCMCSPQQHSYCVTRLRLLCIPEPKAGSGLCAVSGSSGRSNSLQLQRMSSAPARPSEAPPSASPGSRGGGGCHLIRQWFNIKQPSLRSLPAQPLGAAK